MIQIPLMAPTPAAGGAPGAAPGGPLSLLAGPFVPMILMFAVFYFLLIRPQQQKQKDLAKKVGARETINSSVTDLHQALQRLTDCEGPDVILEAVGSPVFVAIRRIAQLPQPGPGTTAMGSRSDDRLGGWKHIRWILMRARNWPSFTDGITSGSIWRRSN